MEEGEKEKIISATILSTYSVLGIVLYMLNTLNLYSA